MRNHAQTAEGGTSNEGSAGEPINAAEKIGQETVGAKVFADMNVQRFGSYHWYVSDKTYEAFITFHAQNPKIYSTLLDLLAEWVDSKAKRPSGFARPCGIALLWNRLRWELEVNTEDDTEYKLNVLYCAGYSRMIMANNPNFDGVFEVRCQKDCPVCPRPIKAQQEISVPEMLAA